MFIVPLLYEDWWLLLVLGLAFVCFVASCVPLLYKDWVFFSFGSSFLFCTFMTLEVPQLILPMSCGTSHCKWAFTNYDLQTWYYTLWIVSCLVSLALSRTLLVYSITTLTRRIEVA